MNRVERRQPGFLNLAINMLAVAGGLIEWNFLDEKVFRPLFDRAADTGKIAREIRKLRLHGRMIAGIAISAQRQK